VAVERVGYGRFDHVWPDGDGPAKSEDFIASFLLYLLAALFCVFSHVFLKKILMTVGCL
jgi:hypothetical protein